MTIFTPRGWTPGLIQQRFASTTPTSYNADSGTIDCVIGRGSPVRRFSGTEVSQLRWDDSNLTFIATKWELLEASLVTVPADTSASVRSLGGDRLFDIVDIRTRMKPTSGCSCGSQCTIGRLA
jgi:hypothetical protein